MRLGSTIILFTIAIALVGCNESHREEPVPEYAVPERTEDELRAALEATCRESLDREVLVLVEFSAPWCSDCQRLHQMKHAKALTTELEKWARLTVNVGMFDRHRATLAAFSIEKIANWSLFEPVDCDAPVEQWSRLMARTLEPSSGSERDTSPTQLAAWLRNIRESHLPTRLDR